MCVMYMRSLTRFFQGSQSCVDRKCVLSGWEDAWLSRSLRMFFFQLALLEAIGFHRFVLTYRFSLVAFVCVCRLMMCVCVCSCVCMCVCVV